MSTSPRLYAAAPSPSLWAEVFEVPLATSLPAEQLSERDILALPADEQAACLAELGAMVRRGRVVAAGPCPECSDTGLVTFNGDRGPVTEHCQHCDAVPAVALRAA